MADGSLGRAHGGSGHARGNAALYSLKRGARVPEESRGAGRERVPARSQAANGNLQEECTEDETGPSHVDLIKRFLLIGGMSEGDIAAATPTPGNSAAIAMYKDITDRGPLHHMIGAGAVEYFYSGLSPKIFEAYVGRYGFTEEQAETYRIHGPMDRVHAQRALEILEEAAVQQQAGSIALAVRDAFVATSLHYDGMLQAALGNSKYWDGT
jgi:pyrroloquinoline quinone (PQQ) biosynthesis protein C